MAGFQFFVQDVYVRGTAADAPVVAVTTAAEQDAYGAIVHEYTREAGTYYRRDTLTGAADVQSARRPVKDIPSAVRIIFEEGRTRDGVRAMREVPSVTLDDHVA